MRYYTGKVDGSIISNYDRSKNGGRADASDLVLVKYKCETNGVPITATSGSTLPLVTGSCKDIENGYNPFEYRKVSHPTTDFETLIHLLKGSLGTGILAMPLAFKHAGLFFGLTATFIIGIICTYCIHILVKCSHVLCRRSKVPSLGYADVAEIAFLTGRPSLRKYSGLARKCIDFFLILDLLGCCCVYVVFVSRNLKQVVDFYFGMNYDVRNYMLFLLPFLLALNLIRNLKYLAPFSMAANLLMGVAMTITFYYVFDDLPSVQDLPYMAKWDQLPLFFGTAIFALEGIGVVMPLENNMKTPHNFIGCPGVLNIGMTVVVILYSTFGFFGYLKYGKDTQGSITLNLPNDEKLAQFVKVAIAISIFITYSLQFYVPMEIIWKYLKNKFTSHSLMIENTIRMSLVTATVLVAVAIPDLGPFISLVGALCLSMLGLIFPSIIELITYRDEPGYGRLNWVIWKNLAIISFGILGFVTGTITSLDEIVRHLRNTKLQ